MLDASLRQRLAPVLGAVRATAVPHDPHEAAAVPPRPFITISRQTGANGRAIAERLVERLNTRRADEAPVWTCWDRELVEKVAADHHLSTRLIEEIEETKLSWLSELLAGISSDSNEDPFRVYHRVAATILALAEAGHVIIVGRGAAFVTRRKPGGIHVRLVAPFAHRAAEIAKRMNLRPEKAAAHVRLADEARAAFYRAHWPGDSLLPESFTITLNTAEIAVEQTVECILPLVRTAAASHARVITKGP
jgi:cytidylate kinase